MVIKYQCRDRESDINFFDVQSSKLKIAVVMLLTNFKLNYLTQFKFVDPAQFSTTIFTYSQLQALTTWTRLHSLSLA